MDNIREQIERAEANYQSFSRVFFIISLPLIVLLVVGILNNIQ